MNLGASLPPVRFREFAPLAQRYGHDFRSPATWRGEPSAMVTPVVAHSKNDLGKSSGSLAPGCGRNAQPTHGKRVRRSCVTFVGFRATRHISRDAGSHPDELGGCHTYGEAERVIDRMAESDGLAQRPTVPPPQRTPVLPDQLLRTSLPRSCLRPQRVGGRVLF